MEALSLTGFKTRSIISLVTVLAVLLVSFAMQQHLIEQQKSTILQAGIANELSERSKSLVITIQALKNTTTGQQRRTLKRYAVEHISRISESLSYFQTTQLPEQVSLSLAEDSVTTGQILTLIATARTMLKDEQPVPALDIQEAEIRVLLNQLRQMADTLRSSQQEHQEFQVTALQQQLILSLTIITVSILFVVVPVLRRVKNDRAAIERQRRQIARIRHTFDTFTDHSQNGILNYVKATGRINFVNQSCLDMLGYQNKHQLTGEPIESIQGGARTVTD